MPAICSRRLLGKNDCSCTTSVPSFLTEGTDGTTVFAHNERAAGESSPPRSGFRWSALCAHSPRPAAGYEATRRMFVRQSTSLVACPARAPQGCTNASWLYREIQQQGYEGAYAPVALYVRHLKTERGATALSATARRRFSPTTIAWWMLADQRTAEEERAVQTILTVHPDLHRAYCLVRQFCEMVRHRQGAAFLAWLQEMEQSRLPVLIPVLSLWA